MRYHVLSQIVPELTHRNHFKFGYNCQPFSFRKSSDDNWFVSYGRCDRQSYSFHDECLATAKLIRKNTNQDLHMMFSGGVDSEVALRSFVESGIPVTAAILRYENDLNVHDISWAVVTCEALGVPYKFYELDLIQFWNTRADDYANETYCVSPQLLATMWLIDQIKGYPIMGSGECLFVKEKPADYKPGISPYLKSDWTLWEKEKIAAWFRHFMIRNREGCPSFFQYTPEIMLSYLNDPFVRDLISDKITGKLSTESSKLAVYQQHFPLHDRPKYTGFEKVQKEDAAFRARLKARFSDSDAIYKTSTRDLELMLKPDEISIHK